MPAMVSRPLEIRAVSEFLQSAAHRPAGLVIEGEPGIGKTTLWLSGVEQARDSGFRVFTARVGQAESVLAYAAVADLLRGVDAAVLAELPDVQRLAVDWVLLRAGRNDHPTDQRVVAAAFVAVFDHLAAQSPVVIAVDDVQWLDQSSRDVLAFAARRFHGPVGLLLTERSDTDGASTAPWLRLSTSDDIERLRVGPLSLGGLHVLISGRLGRSFPRPTMVRIAEISGGNPFFALELARAVEVGSSNAHTGLPDSLSELMRLRIGRLDSDARKLLLAAASAAEPTVELLSAVTDTPIESLGEAEAKGIVTIDRDLVRFTHPLLAQSVYTDASRAERRAIHRSLAKAVTQPELKARHMALASARANPETLEALDAAAGAARARGAPAAAAELTDLAIGLGGDTPVRRIHAAAHHWQAGNPERARTVLEPTVDQLPPGSRRATALNLLAAMRIHDNSFLSAVDLLKRALIDAEGNEALRVHSLLMLSFAQLNTGEFDDSLRNAEHAVGQADTLRIATLTSQALAVSAMVRCMCGLGVDEPSLQRALELEDPHDDAPIAFRASANNALMLAYTGRLEDAHAAMHAVRQHCVERGAEADMMFVSVFTTLIHIWRGDFAGAALVAEETTERAQQLGGDHMQVIATTLRAVVGTYTGQEVDARDDAHAALDLAKRCGSPRLADWSSISLGLLEVSLVKYEDALAVLQPLLSRFDAVPGTEIITSAYLPDAVEAMVSLGRSAEAEPLIEALERNGRRLDRPWMLAVGARCRGMWLAAKGDVDAATRAVKDAMAAHDRLPMPFERARTQLLLGQLQRRRRQKETSRATLREAMQAFEEMGAPLWANRAAAELARAEAVPTHDLTLTPSERRVAELAASGMTNRDVATALFISPKTVEANLGRVYRKLGINTRAELGRVIGEG